MTNTFTEDNLILFIYGEAGPILEAQIKTALLTDKDLQEKHQNLLAVINELESVRFSPHDTSVKIIMEESALSQREEIY